MGSQTKKKRRAEKERKKKIPFLEKKGEVNKFDSLLIFNIYLLGLDIQFCPSEKKGAMKKSFSKKKCRKRVPKKNAAFFKGRKKKTKRNALFLEVDFLASFFLFPI